MVSDPSPEEETPKLEAGPEGNPDPPQKPDSEPSRRGTLAKSVAVWIAVGIAIVSLVVRLAPWGTIHVGIQILDAVVLVICGVIDIREHLREPKSHPFRDGAFLTVLGLITIASVVVDHYRELPRSLSKSQEQAISAAMQPFSGTEIEMQWPASDPEATTFGLQVQKAIEAGGVRVPTKGGVYMFGPPIQPGIHFILEDKPEQRGVFEALARTLGTYEGTYYVGPSKTLVLIIGPKPK